MISNFLLLIQNNMAVGEKVLLEGNFHQMKKIKLG